MGIFSRESIKSFWKLERDKIKVDSGLGVPASGVNIVTTATTTTNILSLTEQTSASSSSARGLPQPPSESTEAKGKSKQAKKAESKPALGLKKLKDPTDTTQVDIVAIHGLNGHREKSFTAENGVCWLTDLLPAEIPTARIFSYGYDARTHDSSPLSTVHLLGHAQQLVEVLTRTRRSTKSTRRPIIFVAHSLGGIILKSALSLSYNTNENHLEDQKDIALSTYGILFMGTPHQGTQEASWGKLVVNLVSIAKNTKTEYIDHLKSDSEWLENQNMHYNAISDRFDTKYFYEEYPTKFLGGEILVVPRSSACMPGATNVAHILIHSDHRGMVRFEDSDDDGFVAVYQSILIMLEAAAEKIGANWNKWESIKAIDKALKISNCIPMKLPFFRNSNFTGRQRELDEIHKALYWKDADPSSLNLRFSVLHGLGGIGKTQLALEYAYSHQEDYDSIWWVNGATTGTLSQGFLKITQELIAHYAQGRISIGQSPDYSTIAALLRLPPDAISEAGTLKVSEDITTIAINVVKSWLTTDGNHQWLFIIDNYDDLENVDLVDFLPMSSARGAVLITSRAVASQRLGTSLEIVEVSEEDGVEMLRKSAHRDLTSFDSERSEAITIVKKLGALPLALDQAGAYINTLRIKFSEYLPLFEVEFEGVAKERPPKGAWQYREDTVFTTWEISFRALSESAQELLLLCAFFDNEDICDELLPPDSLKEEFGIDRVGNCIGGILSLSLAKRRNLEGGIWIHPLVHSWARERLDERKKAKKASHAISLTARLVKSHCKDSTGIEHALERSILPHIQICAKHICSHAYFKNSSSGIKVGIFNDLGVLGLALSYWVELTLALELQKWVLAEREKALGSDHPDTLTTIHNIAYVIKSLGEYDKALDWYGRALAGREKTLGSDHPSTLTTVNNMALVFDIQGKYDDALKWYERAHAGKEKILGSDHLYTATVHNMASLFRSKGEYGKALDWYKRALAGKERTLGSDHPSTLNTVNSIASVFDSQGEYGKAIEWYKQALTGREKTLGSDHLDTLITVHGMALVFCRQGEYDKALDWYKRALAGKEKILGSDHPSTLNTVSSIASVFDSQGEYGKAIEWYKQALTGREKTLGSDHLDTLTTINNMALVFDNQGEYDKALELYKRALAGKEKTLGSDHPDTLTIVNNMASVFNSQEEYDKALRWYERALTGEEKILGSDHPDTLATVNNMALVFDSQGKYGKALELYERALPGLEKAFGRDHPSTLTTAHNMALVFHRQGEYDKALELYERALAGKEKALGSNHPDTLTTIHHMALVFKSQGEYDKALDWYGRALAGNEKTLGSDHPDTLIIIHNIAMVFHRQGEYDKALEWYKRGLVGEEKTLGSDHPDTLTTVHYIGLVFDRQGEYDKAVEWYERALSGRERVLGNDHHDTKSSRDRLTILKGPATLGSCTHVYDRLQALARFPLLQRYIPRGRDLREIVILVASIRTLLFFVTLITLLWILLRKYSYSE